MTNRGSKFLRLVMLIIIGLLFTSCKSDVEDKSGQQAKNQLTVESLKITNKQNIRETNAVSSNLTKKYYSIQACLAENALAQKLDRRKVETIGTPLRSNITDTSGCIFWEHTFNFDYTGEQRCRVLKQIIKLPGVNIKSELNYAIDTITDEITDLSRGKGCTVFKDENIEAKLTGGQGELILDKVGLFWTGELEEKRSDVEKLSYRTKIESCLRARVTDLPVTNTNIKITINDVSGIHDPIVLENTPTDERGCFSRQFSSDYEQFKWSHWLEKHLTIEVEQGPLRGKQIQNTIFVNPYEPSRAFFGIDSRWDRPLENPMPEYNKIHIDGVMYIQIGNDIGNFKVNDYLGLTVSKSYQIVLQPRLDKGHRFTKDKPRYEKMHDGKFKLKFMLLAPEKADIEINEDNFDEFVYITGAEKEVTLKDGIINSKINIPVRLTDLPRLATRAVTVFKLEPVDDIGLRETLVTGFFKAKITWIKTNVFQSDVLQVSENNLKENYLNHFDKTTQEAVKKTLEENAPDYENGISPISGKSINVDESTEQDRKKLDYKRYVENLFSKITETEKEHIYGNPKVFENETSKSIFVRHLNKEFEHLELGKTGDQKYSLPKGLINTLYSKSKREKLNKENKLYKALLVSMCRNAFPKPSEEESGVMGRIFGPGDNPEYLRCQRNPDQFFETDFIMHSKKIYDTKPLYSNGMNLNIGSRFSTMSSEAQTEYLSKRVGADASLKLPFGEFFGVGLRLFDVSYTWSDSESWSGADSDEASTSKQLIIEKFNIEVEGDFEKCVLIKGKEYLPSEALRTMGMAAGLGTAPIILPRQYSQYNKKLEKTYYICDKEVRESIEEPWFYIQAYVPSATMLRDAYGPTEIKLIKVLRGQSTFNEFKKLFEDRTKVYMVQRENNTETPDIKLYENWGHLLRDTPPPSVANKILIRNFEGSFPGTIQ